jgi:hypothetical protein
LVTVMFALAVCPTVTDPNVTDWVEAVSVPVKLEVLDETLARFDVQPLMARLHNTRPSKPLSSRRAFPCLAQKEGRKAFEKRAKVTI